MLEPKGKKENFPEGLLFDVPMGNNCDMEILKKWLSGERGRGVRLAACLGVPPSFVAKMASGEKSVPLEHASAIEKFTGCAVTRRDIRPDDWQDIWPELANPKTTAEVSHG